MKKNLQLAIILGISVATATSISQILVDWLGILRTPGGHRIVWIQNKKPIAFIAGSSLAFDALDWDLISKALNESIEIWDIGGSSPSEWEVLRRKSPECRLTFIAVSPYDLNEHYLSAWHAELVPVFQTIKDLWEVRADWDFSRRLLSQYLFACVRKVFPTIGRSDGVVVGLREKFRILTRSWATFEPETVPVLGLGEASVVRERIGDWPQARIMRRLALMRDACQGRHSFDGIKKLALLRMLHQAQQQGETVFVVLPISPIYKREFLSPEILGDFEDVMIEAGRCVPQVQLLRLDRLPALDSNEYFYDFVHLNMYGQKIATAAFLQQIRGLAGLGQVNANSQ